MKPLCIYHGNCADGFAAAWVVRNEMLDIEFHPGIYQDPPPDVTGRSVTMVDFSYKRPVIIEMAKKASFIRIIDHHKTAIEDLAGIGRVNFGFGHFVETYFDLERSGAGLAWDYFNPGRERPRLIDHIEDRDLWRFKLPGTREIQAALFSYPYDFGVWDKLMLEPVEALRKDGEAIERKHFKDIKELLTVVTRNMAIGNLIVPVANLPYTLTSDAGHALAKGNGSDQDPEHPFAGCYWDTPEGRVFSLRSAEGGADVGEIAKQYGGGGHKHAAGFRISWEDRDVIRAIEDRA